MLLLEIYNNLNKITIVKFLSFKFHHLKSILFNLLNNNIFLKDPNNRLIICLNFKNLDKILQGIFNNKIYLYNKKILFKLLMIIAN